MELNKTVYYRCKAFLRIPADLSTPGKGTSPVALFAGSSPQIQNGDTANYNSFMANIVGDDE